LKARRRPGAFARYCATHLMLRTKMYVPPTCACGSATTENPFQTPPAAAELL
jgi:hypothetical protein